MAFLGAAACGEEGATRPALELPSLSGTHALAGAAPLGRSVDARLVRRIPLSESNVFSPPEFPGDVIDAFVGGLAEEDLPEGLTIDALELTAPGGAGTRPLVALRDPHVLARPALTGDLAGFVPLSGSTVDPAEAESRADRLDALLARVSMTRPCTGSADAVSVFTPRLPTEAWAGARADADGVRFGLVASATVTWALFPPNGAEARLESAEVPPDISLEAGLRFAVRGLGPLDERWNKPQWVVVDAGGGFARVAFAVRLDPSSGRYVDDTPLLAEAPVRDLRGRVDLDLNGTPQACLYGTVQTPLLDAGLWCRTRTSTVWRAELVIPEGRAMVGVHAGAGGQVYAVDRNGTVYVRGPSSWRPFAAASVNAACPPTCVPFDLTVANADQLVFGGDDAQLLAMSLSRGAAPVAVTSVELASFADERRGGVRPLGFLAAAVDPEGKWWLGTADGTLFRGSPDLGRFEAVCLPEASGGRAIVRVMPAPNGELLLGLADGVMARTRWD
ncbi:MAG: hypothetical protein AAFU79_11930 [Myxococcota bacterium]